MDLANFTASPTFDPDQTFTMEFEPMEILNAFTSLVSAVSNVLIILVIYKYSVMRTRPNLYLANWCVCNLIVMLLVPASINLFGMVDTVSYEFACLWEQTLYGVLFGNLMFVLILLVDWYTVMYGRESIAGCCKRINLYLIAVVWIGVVTISVASITFCILDWSYPLSLVCYLISYLAIFVAIVLVYLLWCIKVLCLKKPMAKRKLELILVTSYFLCWLPNWASMYCQIFLQTYFGQLIDHLTFFVGYSHAWVLLALLYLFDKPFRLCLRKMFGAKERILQEEGNSIHKEQNTALL